LNRLVRDKKLVPVAPVTQDVTYHDPCYLGRHNKVYEAPRELVGASGAVLKEMPRHAETGLCCGAGGARMWMEEHIGKRVNHERVDEALMTVSGDAKIATGCPFCRVMMTDGLTDRKDEGKGEGIEVLDVAQLLLAALDTSTVTLPEKGTAAKELEERSAAAAPAEAKPADAQPAEEQPAEEQAAPAAEADAEAKPVKGLGIAGGAKRPGAKKAAPAASAAPTAEAPTKAAPVKGLGMASGAKRPGAKKAAAPEPKAEATAETEAPPTEVVQPPNAAPDEAKTEPAPVKGLGLAAGAKRPGAKKASAPAQPKPEEPKSEAAQPESTPEPTTPEQSAPADGDGSASGPPVKGLGIARGAKPPGKR
jgi:hypothetical protein